MKENRKELQKVKEDLWKMRGGGLKKKKVNPKQKDEMTRIEEIMRRIYMMPVREIRAKIDKNQPKSGR